MMGLFFAGVLWGMDLQRTEPEPPDPLEGVLWSFGLPNEEIWNRWHDARRTRDLLERNEWRYIPTEYQKEMAQVMYHFHLYDAMTDVIGPSSVYSFEKRANALRRLQVIMGDDFFAGRLPPPLPRFHDQ